MSSVLEVIDNKNVNLKTTEYYAAILGESPSKGAKSPTLWNAAFQSLELSAVMHPLDIRPENLKTVMETLKNDGSFIGGAVTMPYKIDVIPYLDELEPEAQIIGAVNCLYRDGKKLVGANTDGAGAVWSLKEAYGEPLAGKNVLQLGTGGAGLAVASYVAKEIGREGILKIANRSAAARGRIAEKLKPLCQTENIERWPVTPEHAQGIDIIINCTSLGFQNPELEKINPLGEQAEDILKKAGKPFVFDIIYQPLETPLLKQAKSLGCRTLNGLAMNLEQAVIAFVKAINSAGLYKGQTQQVRSIMEKAR